jgi:hypothetical protein
MNFHAAEGQVHLKPTNIKMIKLLKNSKLVARNSHRPEIKLSQSVMVEFLSGGFSYTYPEDQKSSRSSIAQICTFALPGAVFPVHSKFKHSTRLFSTSLSCINDKISYEVTGIRYIHIPTNPTNRYKSIQAMVIKDRNPIGKFKLTPSAKGIVTIFITPEGLHHNDSILAHYYDEYRRNFEMKHAFSSHLDNNCNYSILVSIRKAKQNINLRFMTDDTINKDFIINNLDKIIT